MKLFAIAAGFIVFVFNYFDPTHAAMMGHNIVSFLLKFIP